MASKQRRQQQSQPVNDDQPESCDDTQNTDSAYTIQPIIRNPISESATSTKLQGEQTNNEDDLKKKRKISNGETEVKKSIIKRVFTENDGVILLNRILDYRVEKGIEPNSNMTLFHDFVKGSLSFDANKTQVSEKVRRLRIKFPKMKANPALLSPHEKELLNLSEKIWGDRKEDGYVGNNQVKSDELFEEKEEVEDDAVMEDKEEERDVWLLYPKLCASVQSEACTYLTMIPRDFKEFTTDIVSKLGKDKARELEDGWKSLNVKQYGLYAMRMQCLRKQTEAVSDVVKQSDAKADVEGEINAQQQVNEALDDDDAKAGIVATDSTSVTI